MFARHRLRPSNKTRLSSCHGDSRVFTTAGRVISSLSAATIAPFDSFAVLSRSGQAPLACHRREPTNLRVSLGAGAAQLQASGLRVRGHAGACSSAAQRTAAGYVQRSNCPTQAKRRLEWATRAQRTTAGYAGRCGEVVEAGSIAAFDWRCGAFLAKEILRFQHSKLPAVCGKAALSSSQSGEGWVVRASGGLGVEQFSSLRNWV